MRPPCGHPLRVARRSPRTRRRSAARLRVMVRRPIVAPTMITGLGRRRYGCLPRLDPVRPRATVLHPGPVHKVGARSGTSARLAGRPACWSGSSARRTSRSAGAPRLAAGSLAGRERRSGAPLSWPARAPPQAALARRSRGPRPVRGRAHGPPRRACCRRRGRADGRRRRGAASGCARRRRGDAVLGAVGGLADGLERAEVDRDEGEPGDPRGSASPERTKQSPVCT
jgi:hypothetical protein